MTKIDIGSPLRRSPAVSRSSRPLVLPLISSLVLFGFACTPFLFLHLQLWKSLPMYCIGILNTINLIFQFNIPAFRTFSFNFQSHAWKNLTVVHFFVIFRDVVGKF